MPITAFLKLPDIDGESAHVDHENEIEVFAIDWDIEQMRAPSSERGRVRARSDIKPLRAGKYFDAASPYLAQAAAQGKVFNEAILSVRQDGGAAPLDYLVITLTNALVSDYALRTDDPDAPGAPLSEEIELDFERIHILFRVQAPDGSVAAEHEVTLDAR